MTDFVCSLKVSGGDYSTHASYESAIQSDLTAAASQVFAVSEASKAIIADGTAIKGQTSGATGTLEHQHETQAYITGVSGTFQAENIIKTDDSGSTVTLDDTGAAITDAVLEGEDAEFSAATTTYNGWTTDSSHRIVIRAASGAQHDGGPATGFRIKGSSGVGFGIIATQEDYLSCRGVSFLTSNNPQIIRIRISVSTTVSEFLFDDCFADNTNRWFAFDVVPNSATCKNCIGQFLNNMGFQGSGPARNKIKAYYCTAYGNNSTGTSGFRYIDVRNCVAMNFAEGASGFYNLLNLGSNSDTSTLVSSDVSPEIDSAGRSKSTTTQWVGTPGGASADYHIQDTDADLFNDGSTEPLGVEVTAGDVDADGIDRPTACDIGAYEFVASAPSGVGIQTLASYTQSGTGAHPHSGAVAQILSNVLQNGSFTQISASATGAQTLANFLQSGNGVMLPSGVGAMTLADFLQVGSASEIFTIVGAMTLSELQQVGVASMLPSLTGVQVLANFLQAASALQTLTLAGAQTLENYLQASVVLMVPSGAGVLILPDYAQVGSLTHTATDFTADGAQVLSSYLQTGSALMVPSGIGGQILSDYAQAGVGIEIFIASGNQSLSSLTQSASSGISFDGVSAQVLASFVQNGNGVQVFIGTGAQTLASLSQAGVGVVVLAGPSFVAEFIALLGISDIEVPSAAVVSIPEPNNITIILGGNTGI